MANHLDAAWIGLYGVMVGALAGFGGTYLKMRNDAKLEKKKLFREKLEQLHIEIDDVINGLNEVNNSLVLKIKKDWAFKLLQDFDKGDMSKIDMLVNMYARSKKAEYKKFLDCWMEYKQTTFKELMKITVAGKIEIKKDVTEEELLEMGGKLDKTFGEFVESAKELKRVIIDEHRKYI